MALALSIVPPMFGNVLENTRVKSASRELLSGLRVARSAAISRQSETTLKLDVVRGLYTLDAKQYFLELPGTTELVLTTAKSEQISVDEGMIRFFPDGSSTGGQISINNNNQEYTIDVSWLTGQVRLLP
jgi:general secretion pathway protein H